MTQPRLLLIDDEPALADFVANAARETGFDPSVTSHADAFKGRLPANIAPTR